MADYVITNNSSGGTHTGIVETYLAEDAPTINYASSSETRVCGSSAGARKVSLYGITIPNLGAGTVIAAKLRLWAWFLDGGSYTTEVVQIIRGGVDVSQATWNEYSTGNAWGTAGALGGADRGSQLWTGSNAFDENYRDFGAGSSLNSLVQGLVAGGGTLYLAVNRDPIGSGSDGHQFLTGSEGDDGERSQFLFSHEPSGSVGVVSRLFYAGKRILYV